MKRACMHWGPGEADSNAYEWNRSMILTNGVNDLMDMDAAFLGFDFLSYSIPSEELRDDDGE
jgi:hypothetical protein